MGDEVVARLRAIEDRQQIEELRATYCFLVDDGRGEQLVEEWFTDDATCDFRAVRGGSTLAVGSRGREEVCAFFSRVVPALLEDMCHTTHNHRIALDGDQASGDCYFEVTARDATNGEAVVGAGRYVDRYRRVAGRWRFTQRNAEMFYMAPLAQGWVARPFTAAIEAVAPPA